MKKKKADSVVPWTSPRLLKGLFDSNVKVIQVSAGTDHTSAVTAAGELYIWGDNSWGALGNPLKKSDNHPRLILPDTQRGLAHQYVEQVCCGGYHTLALTSGSNLGKDLYKLFEKTCTSSDPSEFSDVTIIVEGRIIHAHKVILARRSGKFREIILSEEIIGRPLELLLPDLRYEVVLRMVEFIYSDSLYGYIVSNLKMCLLLLEGLWNDFFFL